MDNRVVTVFGAASMVGRHTVRALAKAGWRIRAVVRRPGLANFLLPAGEVGQIQLFKANPKRQADVLAALTGAAAVVNLTGAEGPRPQNPLQSGRLARASFEAGAAAFVHVSALGADLEAATGAARRLWRGEYAVRAAFPRATILQPTLVYGPEDKLFNSFAALARILPVLPSIGGGADKVQPVYVCDLAAAVARALADPAAAGRAYQIGGPKVYALKELLEFALAETGRKRWLVPVPRLLAGTAGSAFGHLRMFKSGSLVHPGAFTLYDLGLEPTALEGVVPQYLWRFHPKGQFRTKLQAAAV